MRQLIARITDDLHGRLKARAAAEGRSLNALVTEALSSAVDNDDQRSRLRARLEARSLRVVPPSPRRVPSRDRAIAGTRGAGDAVSRALMEERARR
jgi:plasmid stability protein